MDSETTVPEDERMRFEALFRKHYPAVHRYSARRVGPSAAGDVAAEVFLVAWRRRADIQPGTAQPDPDRQTLTWLLGVARRVCANHLRSRDRAVALDTRLAAERNPHTATREPAGENDPGARLHRALESLRADDRELLMLIAWDGLENREAAKLLGCSPRTLAVRLHRARRRLASALAAQPQSEHATEPTEAIQGSTRT